MTILLRARTALVCLFVWSLLTPAHAQSLASQTIQFVPISTRPATSAPFFVVAIASSELPVALTVQGPASIDDRRLLTLTGAGLVTVTATQPGNTQFAAVSAQLSFRSTPSPSSIAWLPRAITYGMPLSAAGLNATAKAVPLVDPAADTATVTMNLGSSQIAPGAAIPYPQTSSVFRYEGSTMVASPYPNDGGGYVPSGSAPPLGIVYRVAFSCDCEQFEIVVQSRQSTYRLSVDGAYTSLDSTTPPDDYPEQNYVRVQFPDKRVRQIKVSFNGAPPFFGVVTANGDTIAAPQTPLGERVIVFGDSWTGPTIAPPVLPPAQDGLSGSGYAEYLGEYFNWDYWDSGVGGEGFSVAGTDGNGHTFAQRVLTDVCPFSPGAVVIMGGTNDGGSSEAAVQTGIETTLGNLQSCLPGVPIYLYGPQFSQTSLDEAFAAAVPGYSQVHYVNMGTAGWLYGAEDSASTGNEYLYFGGHPTPLGHNFLAEKIAMDLTTAYPSVVPAAYSLLPAAPVTGVISYSAGSSTLLPAGNNTVTAVFTPSDPHNYTSATRPTTIRVNIASTTTALATQGGSATIVATIVPQIGGTPTGSVVISQGGTTLTTLKVSNRTVTFPTGSLGTGVHTLAFTYSGDGNFLGSSNTITVDLGGCQAIDYSKGFSTGAITLNGGATIAKSLLQLTDGGANEARSAFYTTLVPVTSFTTDFTFQLLNPNADGFTFVLQTNNPQQVGQSGGGLGYAGIPNSVALKFDLYNNDGEGSDSIGTYTDGAYPSVPATDLTPSGLNLHGGDTFAAHLIYANALLTLTLTDTRTSTSFTESTSGDLTQYVGQSAYVGFSGGTGGATATQNILSWSYSGGASCGTP